MKASKTLPTDEPIQSKYDTDKTHLIFLGDKNEIQLYSLN